MSCEVKVMMFGGRRCGKTSVIAAMKGCIENQFGQGSHLTLSYDMNTLEKITKKEKEIKKFLSGSEKTFVPDEGPNVEECIYNFDISIKNKNGSIRLSFIDYPGEWLTNPTKQDYLKKHVEESNVFMIAVDTPMLIEEPDQADSNKIGRFNNDSNKPEMVCNAIKSVLKDKANPKIPPLIMFVPLKCEKYFNENRMVEVNHKIHAAYRSLFDFLGGPNEGNFEVAITPILTFGPNTAEFSRFTTDDSGEIKLTSSELPEESIYIRLNPQAVYSPMYCEQPLLYSLEYLLYMARKQKEKQIHDAGFWAFWVKMWDGFLKLPSAKDFLEQEDAIRRKLRKDELVEGYELVHNPMCL